MEKLPECPTRSLSSAWRSADRQQGQLSGAPIACANICTQNIHSTDPKGRWYQLGRISPQLEQYLEENAIKYIVLSFLLFLQTKQLLLELSNSDYNSKGL